MTGTSLYTGIWESQNIRPWQPHLRINFSESRCNLHSAGSTFPLSLHCLYTGTIFTLKAYCTFSKTKSSTTIHWDIIFSRGYITIWRKYFTSNTSFINIPFKYLLSSLKVHLWIPDSSPFLSLCHFLSTVHKLLTAPTPIPPLLAFNFCLPLTETLTWL